MLKGTSKKRIWSFSKIDIRIFILIIALQWLLVIAVLGRGVFFFSKSEVEEIQEPPPPPVVHNIVQCDGINPSSIPSLHFSPKITFSPTILTHDEVVRQKVDCALLIVFLGDGFNPLYKCSLIRFLEVIYPRKLCFITSHSVLPFEQVIHIIPDLEKISEESETCRIAFPHILEHWEMVKDDRRERVVFLVGLSDIFRILYHKYIDSIFMDTDIFLVNKLDFENPIILVDNSDKIELSDGSLVHSFQNGLFSMYGTKYHDHLFNAECHHYKKFGFGGFGNIPMFEVFYGEQKGYSKYLDDEFPNDWKYGKGLEGEYDEDKIEFLFTELFTARSLQSEMFTKNPNVMSESEIKNQYGIHFSTMQALLLDGKDIGKMDFCEVQQFVNGTFYESVLQRFGYDLRKCFFNEGKLSDYGFSVPEYLL